VGIRWVLVSQRHGRSAAAPEVLQDQYNGARSVLANEKRPLSWVHDMYIILWCCTIGVVFIDFQISCLIYRIDIINLSTSFLLWIIIIYLYRYNDILCAPHVRTFHDRLLVHINTRIEWNKTLRYIQGLLSYGIYIKRIRRPWRTIRVMLGSFI